MVIVMTSVKTLFLEHLDHTQIMEHIKNHGTFFSKNNLNVYDLEDLDGLKMRIFSSEDLEHCVELYLEVFSSDPWRDDWRSNYQVRKYLSELISNPVFKGFVVYSDEKLVAACLGHKRSWWSGKEFFIDEFFVANELQGEGLGTYMISSVEELLKKDDCDRISLLTNRDFPAEKFYLKNGFDINEERLVMVKDFS